MPLYKQQGSPFWWADIRIAGKRYRISTKQKGKVLAAQIEAALIHKLSTGVGPSLRHKAPLLREFAQTFLEYLAGCRLEPKTKEYYRNGWRMLSGLDIAGLKLDAITGEMADTLDVPGSGSNVNCAIRTLRRILSFSVKKKVLLSAPRFHLAKENRRERLVTKDEELLILSKASRTLRDVFLLAFDAGMRPNEAASLAWEHVDFIRGVILVVRGKSRNARRYLGMTKRVREMLMERARLDDKWVFASQRRKRKGEHILARSIVTCFSQMKRNLGLPQNVVLYSARHTFATDFMGATGDLSKTQKTMGHGSVTTTMRYLHPEAAELGAIMDARNEQRHNSGHSAETVQ